jgi:hypothetical protein
MGLTAGATASDLYQLTCVCVNSHCIMHTNCTDIEPFRCLGTACHMWHERLGVSYYVFWDVCLHGQCSLSSMIPMLPCWTTALKP